MVCNTILWQHTAHHASTQMLAKHRLQNLQIFQAADLDLDIALEITN